MSEKPSKIVSCKVENGKLVPCSSATVTITVDKVTENSTRSKTKSTTENVSVRDIPLLADPAVNHPSEAFNLEEAKGHGKTVNTYCSSPMSGKPSKIVSCKDEKGMQVPSSSAIVTVNDDKVTENSTPSKTKSTTKNVSVRDIQSLADPVVNHPSEQFNLEEAKGHDGVIPSPPTGNINRGPGAGAYNMGKRAASITVSGGDVSFKLNEDAFKESVPSDGNLNIGPGAGGVNGGEEAASIRIEGGTLSFC